MVPAQLGEPLDLFTSFGDGSVLALGPGNRARRIRKGRVFERSSGTPERIVHVRSSYRSSGPYWLGRTETGHLVVGNPSGGIACEAQVEGLDTHLGTIVLGTPGALIETGFSAAWCSSLPLAATPAPMGVATMPCGLSANPMAWDAHHVYGQRSHECYLD